MAKIREVYICSSCGAHTAQWLGQCPSCHEWNTLNLSSSHIQKGSNKRIARADKPILLQDVENIGYSPYTCGIQALDRILGNGLVPGSAILVGGEPGIGKSTLFLQVAGFVAAKGKKVLYVSGEESLAQIKARAQRLHVLNPNLSGIATSNVEDALSALDVDKDSIPALMIVDSVQTLTSIDVDGLPGNVGQVRAVATILLEACRKVGCTVILIGHVTKDGSLAGPRLLEHMVDTVISLEGDRRQRFRLLRVYKNRFGPNEELLVFQMNQDGLKIIEDPSTFFLEARDASLSGTAIVMAMDGQRPLAVEVQALVARTFLSIPRRAALGFDVNRLHLLLAVLEKRLKVNFGQVDIYAKVSGGIKLQEPGLDLALIVAILSSYYDIPLPEKAIFFGEVDLNGQIRPVVGQDLRLTQAKRLKFNPCIYSEEVSTISKLQKLLFSKN